MLTSMQYAGIVASEETMAGYLPGGRRVYVELLSVYLDAPEGLRDDPGYWLGRLEAGEFEDEENDHE